MNNWNYQPTKKSLDICIMGQIAHDVGDWCKSDLSVFEHYNETIQYYFSENLIFFEEGPNYLLYTYLVKKNILYIHTLIKLEVFAFFLFRHLVAAILFLSLRLSRLTESSGLKFSNLIFLILGLVYSSSSAFKFTDSLTGDGVADPLPVGGKELGYVFF